MHTINNRPTLSFCHLFSSHHTFYRVLSFCHIRTDSLCVFAPRDVSAISHDVSLHIYLRLFFFVRRLKTMDLWNVFFHSVLNCHRKNQYWKNLNCHRKRDAFRVVQERNRIKLTKKKYVVVYISVVMSIYFIMRY